MNPQEFTGRSPGRLLPLGGEIHAFLPDPLPPNIDLPADVTSLSEQALVSIGEFRGLIHSLPNPQLLAQTFVRREAVLSSQIEGTRTELGQLFLFEIGESDDASLLDKEDAQEVYNYVLAHNFALEQLQSLPICGRLLRETHAHLLCGVRGDATRPGQYRDRQAFIGRRHIGEARFVPPPPSYVADAMADLETFINSPSSLPALVRFALIHYQFESIHPFADGNGRLGRLLLALLLSVTGLLPEPVLYLSAYFVRNRRQYMDHLLAVSQEGAWIDWLRFFLEGIIDASNDAVHRSRLLLELREKYRQRYQRKNAGALLMLVERLFVSPAITNAVACNQLGITYNAAQRHIDALAEAGALREVTGRSRNRVYLADEILSVLQREPHQ